MSWPSRLFAALLTCSVLPLWLQRDEAGFVVDVSGRWTMASPAGATRDVKRSAIINAGDEMRKLDATDASAYVVVALYSGTVERYASTTTIARAAGASALERIMKAIRQRFETGVISASVRGGADFADAVLREDDRGVDVAAVFARAPAGSYRVDARPLVDGRPQGDAVRGRVEAAPDRPPLFSARLAPGPYQLEISSDAGVSGTAWVRVATASRYSAAAAVFAQLSSTSPGAGPELRRAARQISRAYLLAIDDVERAR